MHLLGILMLFLSYGGVINHVINGGTRSTNTWRIPAAVTHGLGLLLALVGGFGLLAKIGISWPWPGWVIVKLIIWLLFAAVVGMAARSAVLGKGLWWMLLLLGAVAAYMAGVKPF
ncbi:MAG: hypothetical protein FJZ47_04410 [Candidatus Tectomicrobia bacterium]|uniref:Uncharacterized protein n=1 Tax=Tectimicrobiota bacterium TaxID=2528274 RepID=A0A938AZV8_UNCTE|nr:hypothetical protein [Candidatus Tectomicrobia bacterium]